MAINLIYNQDRDLLHHFQHFLIFDSSHRGSAGQFGADLPRKYVNINDFACLVLKTALKLCFYLTNELFSFD